MRYSLLTLLSLGAVFFVLNAVHPGSGIGASAARLPEGSLINQRKSSTKEEVDAKHWGWASYSDAALSDQVNYLPGWGTISGSNLFSGYVTLDADAGRAFFYALAENAAPAAVPLVLWLNGGPGCSSIGGGFLSELGPLYPVSSSAPAAADGIHLQANPHSWHRFANMLFVESPAFVGFSYSNRTEDEHSNDRSTGLDLLAFLKGFLARFPQYRRHPIYIAGESYAGHYVPTLAATILRAQGRILEEGPTEGERGAAAPVTGAWKNRAEEDPEAEDINLQGFLIGNAWTDTATDNEGAIDFWWTHGIIADSTAKGVKTHCNFSRIGPLSSGDSLCDLFCNRAFTEMGNINIYEIYADVCLPPARAEGFARAMAAAGGPQAALGFQAAAKIVEKLQGRRRAVRGAKGGDMPGEEPGYDPCVDDQVENYLNRPEVQAALHANQTVKLPWRWVDCSPRVKYSRVDLLSSMLPTYDALLDYGGLRIMIYSGDVDGIVPLVGTRRWTAGFGLPEAAPWRSWTAEDGQVGGWTIDYGKRQPGPSAASGVVSSSADALALSLVTIRGAGHMAPYVQPARTAQMAATFFGGKTMP